MKKILIASILLNICCFLNAQFIPESNDVLEYKSSKYFEGDRKDTTFILDVGRDTIVNNQLCKKMFSSFFHCKKSFDESYIYEMDSIVYFAIKGSFSFETLYDFTKKKNEQWRINISDSQYIIVQVDSVYQKRIESEVYKV